MNGLMMAVLGPPGSGKSTFVASAVPWAAARKRTVAVACCPGSEADSYEPSDALELATFEDPNWKPLLKQFQAEDYMRLYKALVKLEKRDEVGVVAIDTASFVSSLVMHDQLAQYQTDDPRALEYGAAYTGHDRLFGYILQQGQTLASRGKHVILTFHVRMREMEGAGEATLQQTMTGRKLRYEDRMLPTLLTSMRQHLGGWFSLYLGTKQVGTGEKAKCVMTAKPTLTVPAKRRAAIRLAFEAPHRETRFPNDFGLLMEAIERERAT